MKLHTNFHRKVYPSPLKLWQVNRGVRLWHTSHYGRVTKDFEGLIKVLTTLINTYDIVSSKIHVRKLQEKYGHEAFEECFIAVKRKHALSYVKVA